MPNNIVNDAEAIDTVDVEDVNNEDTTNVVVNPNKPSDNEAKLLKELMKHKTAAKAAADKAAALEAKFAGVDLDALIALSKKAEEDEVAALEKKGEYERLMTRQKEVHAKELAEIKAKFEAVEKETAAVKRANEQATTQSAFANSRFILDNLTLTPGKTKALYGEYFEIEDGQLVGYDKPRGDALRTKLINGAGDAVAFDEAIKQIINADPDKETLLKSGVKPGAGSEPSRTTVRPAAEKKLLSPFEKMALGLKTQKLVD